MSKVVRIFNWTMVAVLVIMACTLIPLGAKPTSSRTFLQLSSDDTFRWSIPLHLTAGPNAGVTNAVFRVGESRLISPPADVPGWRMNWVNAPTSTFRVTESSEIYGWAAGATSIASAYGQGNGSFVIVTTNMPRIGGTILVEAAPTQLSSFGIEDVPNSPISLTTVVPDIGGDLVKAVVVPVSVGAALIGTPFYRLQHFLARLDISSGYLKPPQYTSIFLLVVVLFFTTLHLPRALNPSDSATGTSACGGTPGTGPFTVKRSVKNEGVSERPIRYLAIPHLQVRAFPRRLMGDMAVY